MRSLRIRARAGGDDGQAAVELALALPVVVVLLLGMLQVALVGRDQLAVELAAREAARAAAVSADPAGAARAAAGRVTTLRPLTVTVRVGGDTVTVTVGHAERDRRRPDRPHDRRRRPAGDGHDGPGATLTSTAGERTVARRQAGPAKPLPPSSAAAPLPTAGALSSL